MVSEEEEEEVEELESQSLAGGTVEGASSGRTFPPLLSSPAPREPWPEGGEQGNGMTELLNGRPTPSTACFKAITTHGAPGISSPSSLSPDTPFSYDALEQKPL